MTLRGRRINPALQFVTEIQETSDIKTVAQMLSSGDWIAICATEHEPFVFSLGRVKTIPFPSVQGNKENRLHPLRPQEQHTKASTPPLGKR